MAIAEIRPGVLPTPVPTEAFFSSERTPDKLYYVTQNGRGFDITTSPFPRVERVAAHEKASLDFVSADQELSEGVQIIIGANANNKFTATALFEKLRRMDLTLIDRNGIVIREVESKTSKGEEFANEARTKIDLLPRFHYRMVDNSSLYAAFLMTTFIHESVRGKIPHRVVFRDPSQTDLIFFTPYPENEEILKKIGRGEFRSVTHRVVEIPNQAAKAA